MTSPTSSIQVSERDLLSELADHLSARPITMLPPYDEAKLADWLAYSLDRCGLCVVTEQRLAQLVCAMKAAEPLPQGDEALASITGNEIWNRVQCSFKARDVEQKQACDALASEIRAALVGSKPLETVPPEVRIWDAYDKAEGISWDDTPPIGDAVRERVARVIELALERHGVPVERFEGTLDDADAAITAIGSQSIAPSGSLVLSNADVQTLMDHGLLHYTDEGWQVGTWPDTTLAKDEERHG